MKQAIQKIAMLGAGNVATHMALAFKNAGLEVLQVYSRTFASAEALASKVGCAATSELGKLTSQADLYVISVSDDAIPGLAGQFPFQDKLLVHTSGTTAMDLLDVATRRTGVFYPLQTFSKEVAVNFNEVPLCLEAARTEDYSLLEDLAERLSHTVAEVSSKERRQVHVAAVFACNFVNHMYAIAADLLEDNDLSFDLLKPLLRETARKVMHTPPQNAQTGPARRNNRQVIETHLRMLDANPGYREIYNFVSESIINRYQEENKP